ncbi:7-carboxy-7-deazaguanine synthase QueE [Tepidiphilus thermophilus]|uniref:7-carboxy-7-deazaguanine synthase n=1 Tax=Tepidiphilus thermophilus TaxID=876478 RepID=A0A0K6INI7_9PROT|nr:7-carboxy-7-deazaguanine synthase QueE [Tepidiphilus thermophilus]MDK2797979.1 7-carboxy-7-deazaguanine synthase [Tepidiphilus sp.]CUB04658.1 putative 7-cyano-7-deazaguanosine (preQ0) biosynthesis protein QueE, gammaproteobacterial type [Tepidiphilus thermophilus]
MKESKRLRVSEIFASLQGESTTVGVPTVFVRLTGCPLRCRWCDTAYAFSGGERLTIDEILARVSDLGLPEVCVTGGEPLAQAACRELLATLADAGHRVSLETSGALSIAGLDPRVRCVMDLKAPGSGEADKNLWDNLDHLRPHDEVKFVLAGRADYDWAKDVLERHGLARRATVLFSPVTGELAPSTLADWIVADRLPVRFQLQLHKILWGDARGK